MEARLTDRQRSIEFIQAFTQAHGCRRPSEIGGRFHVTRGRRLDHLRASSGRASSGGAARRAGRRGRSRSSFRPRRYEVPILGRIAAGTPLLAEENRDDAAARSRVVGGRGDDVFGSGSAARA
jgi:SOS-response transcriptional repressor LexA